MVKMSQKSSVLQAAKSVSQALTPDIQHGQTARIAWLQTSRARGVHSRNGRAGGFATPASYATRASAETDIETGRRGAPACERP